MKKKNRHSILQSGEDDTGAVPPIPVDEVRHLGSDVVARAGDHRGGDRRRGDVVENARRRRTDVRKFNLFYPIGEVGSREGEYARYDTEVSRKLLSQVPLTWTVDLGW